MSESKTTDRQIKSVLQVISNKLADLLLGIYLCGSAVQGGLKKNSDLDFLVVVSEKLSKKTKKQLIESIRPLSKKMGEDNKLRYVEITVIVGEQISNWTYPPNQDFIYGEWLQDNYQLGYIPNNEHNPDLTILLYQARSHYKILLGQRPLEKIIPEIPIEDVKHAIMDSVNGLVAHYDGDETNTILTLCRMILTLKSGKIYPKDIAGEMKAQTSPLVHKQVILLAVSCYKGEQTVRWKQGNASETIKHLHMELIKIAQPFNDSRK